MKNLANLILIPAIVFGLVACAAKNTSSPKREISPPPAERPSASANVDHAEHVHTEATVVNAASTAATKSDSSEELSSFHKAKPVFDKYCARCHTESSGKRTALRHFVMDAYPFGGHHASSMPATIRKVLGQSGKRATMPKDKPGVVSGEELKLILEWADAAERTAAWKQQPANGHDRHDHH